MDRARKRPVGHFSRGSAVRAVRRESQEAKHSPSSLAKHNSSGSGSRGRRERGRRCLTYGAQSDAQCSTIERVESPVCAIFSTGLSISQRRQPPGGLHAARRCPQPGTRVGSATRPLGPEKSGATFARWAWTVVSAKGRRPRLDRTRAEELSPVTPMQAGLGGRQCTAGSRSPARRFSTT